MGFQVVGVSLATLSLSLGAYMSPSKPEHHLPPEVRARTYLSLLSTL